MTQFIQVHFLTSYPPSNLNRDELGRPKTAIMGGVNRLRISSQCLKRAWRQSDLFQNALGEHKGIRTRRMGQKIYQKLVEGGIKENDAHQWTKRILSKFCKVNVESEKFESLVLDQMIHFSLEEQAAINDVVDTCIVKKNAPEDNDLNLLRKDNSAADIACFGRMLVEHKDYSFEAAVQVAHAITTHAVDIEDDYFTAVDDLNEEFGNSGAAFLGETEFAAGLFYGYICINRELLEKNLRENKLLAQKTIHALIESVAKVSPTGKQNSFASRAYTSYMLIEKGSQQPRSLSAAFLNPIKERGLLKNSIEALEKHRENIDRVYGQCADARKYFNTENGEGTLAEVVEFTKAN